MDREKAIEYIEGMTGTYGVWHEWTDEAIKKLYIFVCVKDHGSLTIEDSKRLGFGL